MAVHPYHNRGAGQLRQVGLAAGPYSGSWGIVRTRLRVAGRVNSTSSVALKPPAVHGEYVSVRRTFPGELTDVVSTTAGEADDGMLRMERGARKPQAETPGVIEVCLDQWLGPVGGDHSVGPRAARERMGILSPTLHEDSRGSAGGCIPDKRCHRSQDAAGARWEAA